MPYHMISAKYNEDGVPVICVTSADTDVLSVPILGSAVHVQTSGGTSVIFSVDDFECNFAIKAEVESAGDDFVAHYPWEDDDGGDIETDSCVVDVANAGEISLQNTEE